MIMSDKNVSFEDLGIQLGVTNDIDAKKKYLDGFKANQEETVKRMEQLVAHTSALLEKYSSTFKSLNDGIISFLKELKELKKSEIKNTVTQTALTMLSKEMDDDQRKRLLENAVSGLEKLISNGEERLNKYKESLEKDLDTSSVKALIEKHVEEQKELFETFRSEEKKREDFSKGFDYGQAVKKLID